MNPCCIALGEFLPGLGAWAFQQLDAVAMDPERPVSLLDEAAEYWFRDPLSRLIAGFECLKPASQMAR